MKYLYINLPIGNSTICLTLIGYDNTSFEDCISVYRTPPVARLVIESAVLSSENNRITLTYRSENFSGTVYWISNSSNSNYNTTSYASSLRTKYFYPDKFGQIEICGTISNSVTECVTVNRIARQVTGTVQSPNNNTVYQSRYVYLTYYTNNYSDGYITLNGNDYLDLGSSFDHGHNYSSSNNTTQISIGFGLSTICLELTGEDATQLRDCIQVHRVVPNHLVMITYPSQNTSFVGSNLEISYSLQKFLQ